MIGSAHAVARRGRRPQTQLSPEALADRDDRGTPPELFGYALERWGPFTVDVAASARNAKCRRFYTKATNGLLQPWDDERAWGNVPFSDPDPWVAKAWESRAIVAVLLLPAIRTEQPWWQDMVEPFRDRPGSRLITHFVRRRTRFLMPGANPHQGNHRPSFGVVFVVLHRTVLAAQRDRGHAGAWRRPA